MCDHTLHAIRTLSCCAPVVCAGCHQDKCAAAPRCACKRWSSAAAVPLRVRATTTIYPPSICCGLRLLQSSTMQQHCCWGVRLQGQLAGLGGDSLGGAPKCLKPWSCRVKGVLGVSSRCQCFVGCALLWSCWLWGAGDGISGTCHATGTGHAWPLKP